MGCRQLHTRSRLGCRRDVCDDHCDCSHCATLFAAPSCTRPPPTPPPPPPLFLLLPAAATAARYHLALKLAKDPRFERIPSYLPKGCYADDDLVECVRMHRCYIVATCDRDLRRRLRKIPGVPLMYIKERKYTIERMAEAFGAKS